MTTKKKKKAKKSSPGRSAPTSPSSSTQTSGDNKQQTAQSTASSSPVNCDLAAADIAGSDTNPFSDLLLEHNATGQIENGAIDLDLMDNDEIPSTPTKEFVGITQETSTNQSVLPAVVVNPELQDIGAAAPSSAKSIVSVLKNTSTPPAVKPSDEWVGLFKCKGKKLEKKGEPFTLPSGELCVQIPNAVIEKNMKAWECFVIGQFYSDPPAQGLIHTIAYGIWSKRLRDITVSKLEGHAYLFRIPNAETRHHVITQRLWQFEGKTMFVAHWEPGFLPEKPAITSAPIWLELRNVPLQFFNEDGLERIAGLVGHPKYLHPATANKTILDVAKVLTIIDPRKPLPEAVNVQFDSEIGHTIKRCPAAPVTCKGCKSTAHLSDACPRSKGHNHKNGEQKQKQKYTQKQQYEPIHGRPSSNQTQQKGKTGNYPSFMADQKGKEIDHHPLPAGNEIPSDPGLNSFSKTASSVLAESSKARGASSVSEVESDSSDVASSDSDVEEGPSLSDTSPETTSEPCSLVPAKRFLAGTGPFCRCW
ncbi:unnamed protein product [Brassica oleracea var. botrytis]|uniref:DUF4283 domain-containing protein n=2 Tax=Brassica oleracea TaxID=3712 RepID=A0A0D3DIM2_BRAOL|nr:unnamed protein product [Brassica oleracea]